MTTSKVKKVAITIATLVGFGVLATAAVRAQESAKSSGTSFTKAFGNEVKSVFKTNV